MSDAGMWDFDLTKLIKNTSDIEGQMKMNTINRSLSSELFPDHVFEAE